MEAPQENVVPDEFDPIAFWESHKNQILLLGFLLIAGLAAFVVYRISTHRSLAESQALFEQARDADGYRLVIAEYPRSMAAANAHLLLAQELRDRGKLDEAITVLRQLTGQFPEHPLASTAWISLAGTLQQKGDTEEALRTYQQVTTQFPTDPGAPAAFASIASLHRAKGETVKAREAYEALVSQFPESYYARQAQQELQFLK